jgi:acyl-CoA reductase-like NAD-dependent aldehyde dehydrogenase
MRSRAFIAGGLVDAADGRTFETVSPRDESVLATVARCDIEDVSRAVAAAREAFDRGDWALADPAARGRVLNVVPRFGEEAGQALGRHPDVDKVAFTGSVAVGRLFQRYAGESNGKSVSLELVLVIQTAADPEDALRLANDTRYGLAAALWTADLRTAGRLARRLRAGTVWVNTFDASSLATPFGGVKDSGLGRSLPALDSYTSLKTTWMSFA